MTIQIQPIGPKALELGFVSTIDKTDYEAFTPYAEAAIKQHGKVNFLVRLPEKLRFTPAALWEDLKFDVAHYNDVGRVALVSDDDSKRWLATISKPFTKAEVRFYQAEDVKAARSWVSD